MNTPTAPIPLDHPRMLSTKTASAALSGSGSACSAEHSGLALQANSEKLVTAGWVGSNSDAFFIARYNGVRSANPTGALDTIAEGQRITRYLSTEPQLRGDAGGRDFEARYGH